VATEVVEKGFDGDAGTPNGEGDCDNRLLMRFKAT